MIMNWENLKKIRKFIKNCNIEDEFLYYELRKGKELIISAMNKDHTIYSEIRFPQNYDNIINVDGFLDLEKLKEVKAINGRKTDCASIFFNEIEDAIIDGNNVEMAYDRDITNHFVLTDNIEVYNEREFIRLEKKDINIIKSFKDYYVLMKEEDDRFKLTFYKLNDFEVKGTLYVEKWNRYQYNNKACLSVNNLIQAINYFDCKDGCCIGIPQNIEPVTVIDYNNTKNSVAIVCQRFDDV